MADKFRRGPGGFRGRTPPTITPPEPPGGEYEPSFITDDIQPWGYYWAGDGDEHLTLGQYDSPGPRIAQVADISGNSRHWTTSAAAGGSPTQGLSRCALYQNPYVMYDLDGQGWTSYETAFTPLARVGSNGTPTEYGIKTLSQWYDCASTMVCTGEFYFCAVMTNRRTAGSREMWGRTPENRIRISQPSGRIYVYINDATQPARQTEDGAVTTGPIILEVWRESDNTIKVWCNGSDVGNDIVQAGTLSVNGFGYQGTGSSGWDDDLFWALQKDGLPNATLRGQLRTHLSTMWGITIA